MSQTSPTSPTTTRPAADVDGAIERRDLARFEATARQAEVAALGAAASGPERTALERAERASALAVARAEQAVTLAVQARLVLALRAHGVGQEAKDLAQAKLARTSGVTGAGSSRDLDAELSRCSRGRANALVWTVGANAANDYHRRRVREEPVAEPEPEGADDGAEEATGELLVGCAWNAVEALSPEDRDAIFDFHLRGLSDDDLVARELGREPRDDDEAATVRARIQQRRSRARRRAHVLARRLLEEALR